MNKWKNEQMNKETNDLVNKCREKLTELVNKLAKEPILKWTSEQVNNPFLLITWWPTKYNWTKDLVKHSTNNLDKEKNYWTGE